MNHYTSACNDNDGCTINDRCQDGTCIGDQVDPCPSPCDTDDCPLGQCCDEDSGECVPDCPCDVDDDCITQWCCSDARNICQPRPCGPGPEGVPDPPTGVTASDGTYADKIRVTWSSVSGADEYRVFRCSSSSTTSSCSGKGSWQSGRSYDDLSANADTTYWYRVKARNDAGESPYSSANSGHRDDDGPDPCAGVNCDDGDFCNGEETCIGGVCFAADPPCVGVGNRLCDEADDDCCIECTDDGDCASDEFCEDDCCSLGFPPPPRCTPENPFCEQDDLFCNGREVCDTATGTCGPSGSPCESGERCNESSDCCENWVPGMCGSGAWVCVMIGSFAWLGMRLAGSARRRRSTI